MKLLNSTRCGQLCWRHYWQVENTVPAQLLGGCQKCDGRNAETWRHSYPKNWFSVTTVSRGATWFNIAGLCFCLRNYAILETHLPSESFWRKYRTIVASYPTGTRGSFLGVKRPGREADHSPPSSAEVKNEWSYTSTPPVRLHGVVLS
jgi:hypothetical protein